MSVDEIYCSIIEMPDYELTFGILERLPWLTNTSQIQEKYAEMESVNNIPYIPLSCF
jgi:hypothetical protein